MEEINTWLVCISCWLIVSYPFKSDFSSFVFQVLTAGQKLQFYLCVKFCVECKRKRIGTTLLSISLILHSKSVTDEEVLDYNTGRYTPLPPIELLWGTCHGSAQLHCMVHVLHWWTHVLLHKTKKSSLRMFASLEVDLSIGHGLLCFA